MHGLKIFVLIANADRFDAALSTLSFRQQSVVIRRRFHCLINDSPRKISGVRVLVYKGVAKRLDAFEKDGEIGREASEVITEIRSRL